MRLAAIDIGTNAIRLLIKEVFIDEKGEDFFKKISLTRIPIRLGTDVFKTGEISDDKISKVISVMKAFQLLMDANDVKHYRACATSAMREAKNGKLVMRMIQKLANINLEVISGTEEAKLIFNNFYWKGNNLDKNVTYLYIDVGGGSTEVSLIKKGKRIKSYSFKIGTVRLLETPESVDSWDFMKEKITSWTKDTKDIISIGTGGNINRIYKESSHSFGQPINYSEIKNIVKYISEFNYEDRIKTLKLKPDRADVIVPAGEIYTTIMKAAKSKSMLVPKVGLSDGMILNLYQNMA